MNRRDTRESRIMKMEGAGQALIQQAYILASVDNHTPWQRRDNSAELLRRARVYSRCVQLVR